MLFYFKHEIPLFQVLMSLKVFKFDTKNLFKFFKFSGTKLGRGGQALVQKRGQVSIGGLTKFLPDGGPPVLPQKTLPVLLEVLLQGVKQNLFLGKGWGLGKGKNIFGSLSLGLGLSPGGRALGCVAVGPKGQTDELIVNESLSNLGP